MNPFIAERNLTQYEHEALNRTYNLADGHAHQRQNPSQRQIIAQLPTVFYRAETAGQRIIEDEFRQTFFQLAGQRRAIDLTTSMFCYSASVSMEIAALLLGRK